jgi:hypothetical protein
MRGTPILENAYQTTTVDVLSHLVLGEIGKTEAGERSIP